MSGSDGVSSGKNTGMRCHVVTRKEMLAALLVVPSSQAVHHRPTEEPSNKVRAMSWPVPRISLLRIHPAKLI